MRSAIVSPCQLYLFALGHQAAEVHSTLRIESPGIEKRDRRGRSFAGAPRHFKFYRCQARQQRLMFQSYALFPALSVLDKRSPFSLKMKGRRCQGNAAPKAAEMLELVDLNRPWQTALPAQLSRRANSSASQLRARCITALRSCCWTNRCQRLIPFLPGQDANEFGATCKKKLGSVHSTSPTAGRRRLRWRDEDCRDDDAVHRTGWPAREVFKTAQRTRFVAQIHAADITFIRPAPRHSPFGPPPSASPPAGKRARWKATVTAIEYQGTYAVSCPAIAGDQEVTALVPDAAIIDAPHHPGDRIGLTWDAKNLHQIERREKRRVPIKQRESHDQSHQTFPAAPFPEKGGGRHRRLCRWPPRLGAPMIWAQNIQGHPPCGQFAHRRPKPERHVRRQG